MGSVCRRRSDLRGILYSMCARTPCLDQKYTGCCVCARIQRSDLVRLGHYYHHSLRAPLSEHCLFTTSIWIPSDPRALALYKNLGASLRPAPKPARIQELRFFKSETHLLSQPGPHLCRGHPLNSPV